MMAAGEPCQAFEARSHLPVEISDMATFERQHIVSRFKRRKNASELLLSAIVQNGWKLFP